MSEKTRYQTFVFKGEPSEDFELRRATLGGMEMAAWAEGHQLREKDKLEEFIRALASGDIDFPENDAQQLMQEMKTLDFDLKHKNAKLPTRAYETDAGLDIRRLTTEEDL